MVRLLPIALIILSISAHAQNYGFSIPWFHCTATVNNDRSLVFENDSYHVCAGWNFRTRGITAVEADVRAV